MKRSVVAMLVTGGGAILIGVIVWWAMRSRLRVHADSGRVYQATLNGAPFIFTVFNEHGQRSIRALDEQYDHWEPSSNGFNLIQVAGDLTPARHGEVPRLINRRTNILARLDLDARHVPVRLWWSDSVRPNVPAAVARMYSVQEDFGLKLGPIGSRSGYEARFPKLTEVSAEPSLWRAVNRRMLVYCAEFAHEVERQQQTSTQKHSWFSPSEFNEFDRFDHFVLTHCTPDLVLLDRQETDFTYATTPPTDHRPFMFVLWQGIPYEVNVDALWGLLESEGVQFRRRSRPAQSYEISPTGVTRAQVGVDGWKFEGVTGPYANARIETFNLTRAEFGRLLATHLKQVLQRIDKFAEDQSRTP